MSSSSLQQVGSPWLFGQAGSLDDALARPALSTRQVARVLGVSERSVRRAIASGTLPAERDGAVYRISPLDVQRWAAQKLATAPPAGDDLPGAPPLRSALPRAPLSTFIGRAEELQHLLSLLEDPAERLLTLTGPGGAGKTRLAIEVAGLLQPHLQDGVCFVQLESVRDPALFSLAVAGALGLDEQPGGSMINHVVESLRPRRMLLLLDNFEQILPAAPDVAMILTGAPEIQVLITSRAPLRISGERVVALPPMRLPQGTITPEALLASDASQLFLERAQRRSTLPPLDNALANVVAAICAQVDALPLGIELAAATTHMFTVHQLLERLERRLPLLEEGPRDAPARHATMRNAIAWSYDLLSPEEQALFCRLSVFVGGFTIEAAEWLLRQTAPGAPSPSAATLLGSLLDHSLIRRIDGPGGAARYVMLETIREFGLELVARSSTPAVAHADHARYFREMLTDILPLASVSGVRAPLERLAAEQANLRESLTWLQAHGSSTEFVEQVAAMGLAWYPYCAYREGQHWLEAALAHHDAAPLCRAQLLIGYGGVCFAQGNQEGVPEVLDEADALLASIDAPIEKALIPTLRGALNNREGNYAAARQYLDEAHALASQIPDPVLRTGMIGRVLSNQAITAWGMEAWDSALQLIDEAMQHYAVGGFDLATSRVMVTHGVLTHINGDPSGALAAWHRALKSMGTLGDPRTVADAISLAATASVSGGEHDAALMLFGAAEAMREREGADWSWRNNTRELRALETARRTLGAARANQLIASGRAFSRDEAVALIGLVASRAQRPTRPLTGRQIEVLQLLANGNTDREIADALFLSRRTVSWHVSAILDFFGATTRDDAIARARSDGVIPA